MNVPQLDLKAQHTALLPHLREVFEQAVSDTAFVLGPTVREFETQLARHCCAVHAVGVSSGTDALLSAMMALGIGPGDEVVTTPFSFFATAGAIARLGATPKFVDIDPQTFNLDPAGIESAITDRTRVILPVHLYGLSADMDPILTVAKARDLFVIEDAAQAIGALYHGRSVGALGDIGALSFYPTKNLAALGDAGACLTQHDDLAESLQLMRLHGMAKDYRHLRIGGNFRIDAIQAAFLQIKLRYLSDWTQARQRIAARYDQMLANTPLYLPVAPKGYEHVYHQYTVRTTDNRRDALLQHLAKHGIGARVYYPLPLHLQPCFEYLGGKRGQFPHTESAGDDVLSLPMFPELTEPQQDAVVKAIKAFYS